MCDYVSFDEHEQGNVAPLAQERAPSALHVSLMILCDGKVREMEFRAWKSTSEGRDESSSAEKKSTGNAAVDIVSIQAFCCDVAPVFNFFLWREKNTKFVVNFAWSRLKHLARPIQFYVLLAVDQSFHPNSHQSPPTFPCF